MSLRNHFHKVCSQLGFEVRLKRNLTRNKEREALDKACALWDSLVRQQGIRTMLDIGAHTGQFAAMIRRNNPRLRLICFEPIAASFAQLKSTCQTLGDVDCRHLALGSEAGEVTMNVSDFSPSSSLLTMLDLHRQEWPASADHKPETVRVCRLDDVPGMTELPDPLGIKIDVQGFEDRVIAGGTATLRRAGFVVIETSFYPLYEGQPLFDSVYDRMRKLGFAYHGALSTARSRTDGRILQEDSVFLPAVSGRSGEGSSHGEKA